MIILKFFEYYFHSISELLFDELGKHFEGADLDDELALLFENPEKRLNQFLRRKLALQDVQQDVRLAADLVLDIRQIYEQLREGRVKTVCRSQD